MQNNGANESASAGQPPARQPAQGKKSYTAPVLQKYGSVQSLTQSGGSSKTTDSKTTKRTSDLRCKSAVVRIGTHPLGFGLYLFDYKPGFAAHGAGRQFGVIAQEVETVLPSAVSIDGNGYRKVDYSQLGIVLH
ncbi:MAG TPA: tail fiber domain-containing protein [Candidatus Acidoferrum sp.]|nr:tail fiber domain-containing protein [Candidatus Acidoferrum sp.]